MNRLKFAFPIVAIVFLALASCGKVFDEWFYTKKLTLDRKPYNGNELRTDGYYYYMNEGEVFDSYILYKNGVIIHGENTAHINNNSDPLYIMDSMFLSDSFVNDLDRFNYGIFQIQGECIVIEKWISQVYYRSTVLMSGNILNDTTFILTKMVTSENEFLRDKLFHFRAFSPKPDSTNIYIP